MSEIIGTHQSLAKNIRQIAGSPTIKARTPATNTGSVTPSSSVPPGAPVYTASQSTPTAPADPATDAVEKAKEGFRSAQGSMGKAYEDALNAIRNNAYESETSALSKYVNRRGDIDKNLKRLDVDFQDSDLAKKWAVDSTNLQRMADQARTNNLGYIERMRAAEESQYNAILAALASGELIPAAAIPTGGLGGSGGGGGRSGGGSGSSGAGGFTSTGQEDIVQQWPEVVQSLLESNNPLAERALGYFDRGGQDPVDALRAVSEDIESSVQNELAIRDYISRSPRYGPAQQILDLPTNPLARAAVEWLNAEREEANRQRSEAMNSPDRRTATDAKSSRRNTMDLARIREFFRSVSPGYVPTVKQVKVTNRGKEKFSAE